MSHDLLDATLIRVPAAHEVQVDEATAEVSASLSTTGDGRYIELGVLGTGGMGEVCLVHDVRLDRDVALKRMHAALSVSDFIERFVREVRVQGRLEHPAMVPVYDLALSSDGHPYFTMKRVRGQTLFEVLELLKANDAATQARFSRFRLFAAYTTVCLAVDAAHAQGVLHRDLKPSNIMLGEFGEVHVLDWGLAKIKGQPESNRPVANADEASAMTTCGATMGTPGYMSPEQADGRMDELDERSDIYALGVILHELLYLAPVHDDKTPVERLLSTRRRHLPDSKRAGVAPELDAIWRRACAAEPHERFRSARELAEAVERYLDGERDEERRRQLAQAQLTIAENADSTTHAGRSSALQALGRALALEPTNARALSTLSALLAEVPKETPPNAKVQLEQLSFDRVRTMTTATAIRQFTWAAGLGATMLVLGVRSLALAIAVEGLLLAAMVVTAALARRSSSRFAEPVASISSLCSVIVLAVGIGPLLVVPTLAATHAMLFATSAEHRRRIAMMVASAAVVLIPSVFEPLGPLVRSENTGLSIVSPLLDLSSPATPLVLLLLSMLPVVTPTLLVGRLRDAFVNAERSTVLQAAALTELIPRQER